MAMNFGSVKNVGFLDTLSFCFFNGLRAGAIYGIGKGITTTCKPIFKTLAEATAHTIFWGTARTGLKLESYWDTYVARGKSIIDEAVDKKERAKTRAFHQVWPSYYIPVTKGTSRPVVLGERAVQAVEGIVLMVAFTWAFIQVGKLNTRPDIWDKALETFTPFKFQIKA